MDRPFLETIFSNRVKFYGRAWLDYDVAAVDYCRYGYNHRSGKTMRKTWRILFYSLNQDGRCGGIVRHKATLDLRR
jgi:hypothetical protein